MLCDHVLNSHEHCEYKAVILQGEIWCWSLLGLKGLKRAPEDLQEAWVGVDSASGEWWEGKREKNEIQIKCTIQVACACVVSVSVRFRSKEQGTRVKDRAKNGASKRAGRGWRRKEGLLPSPPHPPSFSFWLSFHFLRGQNRKSRSSVFFAPKLNGKRLLRRPRFKQS